MTRQGKLFIALIAGVLVLFLLLYIGGELMDDASEPDDAAAGPVSDQVWKDRNLDTIILAVMMFAGVLGVLALVGGEFKWN